ncbi:MAG: hypothetical protein LT071_14900 [Nocardioides sp.]|nr:hypothetical protein [Nocardioides sp.]
MKRTRSGVVLAVALLAAGCSSSYEPPDPADPAVVRDAATLAEAVEADTTRLSTEAGDRATWTCEGELWGRDGAALLGVATCDGTYEGEPEPAGFVTPVRVEGDEVTYAEDGSGYTDSVREMWGDEIAEAWFER